MKTVIRNSMFETNSSSMHSVVLKKIDSIPTAAENKDYYYEGLQPKFREYNSDVDLINWRFSLKDREGENYYRQKGRLLLSTEDKMQLFLVLLARDIMTDNPSLNTIESFSNILNSKINELNKEFFNNLGLNIIITEFPEYDTFEIENDTNQLVLWLPGVEDSDNTLENLLKELLSNYNSLYSFLFLPESFVLLGGDEYETSFTLEKIVRGSIKEDCEIRGHLNWVKVD